MGPVRGVAAFRLVQLIISKNAQTRQNSFPSCFACCAAVAMNVGNDDLTAVRDRRYLQITFALVLGANLACSLYASIDARGLYHDGVYYLLKIAEGEWFFLHDPPRNVVQVLRQAPIVFLSKFTDMSLFGRAQVFSFILLLLPASLWLVCWLITPRCRKVWMLFPLAYLLIGFAPTSFHAIGEAAVAAGYFWIMLFLLLFRTRRLASQLLFLLLCIFAIQLHEGAFPLMLVLLLACACRAYGANGRREKAFLAVSALLVLVVVRYELNWVIHPQSVPDRQSILEGLETFQFVLADGHVNLPLISGTVASAALIVVFFSYLGAPATAVIYGRRIAVGFAVLSLVAVVVSLSIEQSFAPFAQLQARYHPVFVSAALGTAAVFILAFRLPDRLWMQPATVSILLTLCMAQTVADAVATGRWHAYVIDFRSRLANAQGLVPWETMLHTGDASIDTDWRLMAVPWVIPVTSIVFAPGPNINSLIDLPAGFTYRPVDPEKPDRLPYLRGIDYAGYRRFIAAQKLGTGP
jgi:hypothetical protein